MRFAGTRIEGFLGDSPDYGKIVSGASTLKSKESQAATDLMGKTAATGISAAGQVKGAELTGAAESQLASAKGTASMLNTLGKVGGSFITAGIDAGAFGGGGGYNLGDPIDLKSDYSIDWNTPIDTGVFKYWS